MQVTREQIEHNTHWEEEEKEEEGTSTPTTTTLYYTTISLSFFSLEAEGNRHNSLNQGQNPARGGARYHRRGRKGVSLFKPDGALVRSERLYIAE